MSSSEFHAANRLMIYSMLLAASFTLTRTVGDSLFLARVGSVGLPGIFVASGCLTALIAGAWYALTRRMRLSISIRISGFIFSALTFAAWYALPMLHHSWWLLAAIYLLAEIKGCVNTINIVTSMNSVLGGRSSRAAWTRVGIGAPLAGMVIGVLIGLEASITDLRTWLLLSAILDTLSVFPLRSTALVVTDRVASAIKNSARGKEPTTGEATAKLVSDGVRKLKSYTASRQFRFWIATLISTKVVVLTLVAFFWKVSVNDYFHADEPSLAEYFGYFYAVIGLLTLLVQLLVTGRLLKRRSFSIPILVMPVSLLMLTMAFVLVSGGLVMLATLTLARSMEVWRRSVHDTTLNLLYTRIPRSQRRSTIAFNTAAVKPLSEVGASLVLWLCSPVVQRSVLLMGTGVWLLATINLLRLISKTRSRKRER